MNTLRKYVAELDHTTKLAIVNSYEQFEEDGFIGESPIRHHAEEWMRRHSASDHVTMFMTMLAMEVYRDFAKRYLTPADYPKVQP